jgi:FecR protein
MRPIYFLLVLSVVSSFCAATASPLYDPEKPVALVFKPIGTVEFIKNGKSWAKAAPSTPLMSGDRVRTGENSFVVIKFIENSILRLQENSEITISGEMTANKEFSKNVHLARGELDFDVKKREGEKFEFSTPTSVASIRGTQGLLINGGDSSDVLILGAGLVVFTNTVSNKSVDVGAGQTARSFANGKIEVKQTTPEELKRLQNAASSGNGGGGGTANSGASSSGQFSVGFAVSTPVVTQGQDATVTVELVQTTVPVDTLKGLVSYFALAYKNSTMGAFREVPATLSGSNVKFTIPGSDVISPSIQVYVIFRTRTGISLTYPTDTSNPIVVPVQSTSSNELRIQFTDPNGKQKIMVIDY